MPGISSEALSSVSYSYRHICRQKLPDEVPEDGIDWYCVGKLRDFETESPERPQYDYKLIKQSDIKIVFLKDTQVEFVLASTEIKFQIGFQSVRQRNAFYRIAYDDVNLSQAVSIVSGSYLTHFILANGLC